MYIHGRNRKDSLASGHYPQGSYLGYLRVKLLNSLPLTLKGVSPCQQGTNNFLVSCCAANQVTSISQSSNITSLLNKGESKKRNF